MTRSPDAIGAASDDDFGRLLAEIRNCNLCAAHLPLSPRPIVRASPSARLLIISQAPGVRARQSGLSFDDRSGDRLRGWLGLDRDSFYDKSRVAILPIGFCYPGRDGKSGDLPPRPECAPLWHARIRALMPAIELTLLVGRYAIGYYLPSRRSKPMTGTVENWREFLPRYFVLPHPSWHVTRWLRDNPSFESDVLPQLRARVAAAVSR